MTRKTVRFVYALLMALFVLSAGAAPAMAQSSAPVKYEAATLQMRDGWKARGMHSAADDFVVVCPTQEVLDPSHPCSEGNARISPVNDLVLVCPVKEVLDPQHPCSERRAQISQAGPDDFVLVCPVKEVLDPNHPCAKQKSGNVRFEIPGSYVMTCPVKEVLDPKHPCAE